MRLLTGKEVANSIYQEIRETLASLPGLKPTLAVILVGDDPSSQTYVHSKHKKCEELGFGHLDYHLPSDTSMECLITLVEQLNNDSSVHGILVQSPLPPSLDEQIVVEAIDPRKDVDGFHPVNVGKLLIGLEGMKSCTPYGVMQLLSYYQIPLRGKHVVIIGRSNIVGKPMGAMLIQNGVDATVTICHSKTENLEKLTRNADIVMVAVGKPNFLSSDMVREGAVVIDFGISRIADPSAKKGYRIVGDVDFESVSPKCEAITPVPGGVGVMTIAMLMYNTLKAAISC